MKQSASLASYVFGFGLSIVLTLSAYALVAQHIVSGGLLLYSLASLAIIQMLMQLLFFLHLGHESQPRWRLLVFGFMLLVVAILVCGSLWIMSNLDYHMMSPQQTDEYIVQDEGIGH